MEATEYSVTVPVELVTKTKGLALDIGLSDVSIVYRSRENLDEAKSHTIGVEGHLQMVSFPKSKLTEAMEYIKHRSTMMRKWAEEKPEIFATGTDCTQLRKAIFETLNIRVNNVRESNCFVKAFIYLASRLKRIDLVEPRDEKATEEARAEITEMIALFLLMQKHCLSEGVKHIYFDIDDIHSVNAANENNCQSDGSLSTCEDIYPCILIICGCGIQYVQVNADKSFKMIDMSNRGGSSLLGMGTVLTGCKNLEEFLELASRGDSKHIDNYTNDLFTSDAAAHADDNVYINWAELKTPSIAFNFGKTVEANKEDLRPEDLATSWLIYTAQGIAQCLTLVAKVNEIKRLFFCGILCNSPLFRSILTKELTKRILLFNALQSKKVTEIQFDFLKSGSHLGALGVLITELEKLTGESSSNI